MKIREVKNILTTTLIPKYGEREANSIVTLMLEEIWGVNVFNHECDIDICEEQVTAAMSRLEKNEPVQYVIGHSYFYDRKFTVSPSVLIPRQETEELVYWVLKTIGGRKEKVDILDIGTGSGAIALTLALDLEGSSVSAVDISTDALSVAQNNATNLGAKVSFCEMDVLNCSLEGDYDIIISNPPYVTDSEKVLMHSNVLSYEPHSALFVSDADPLLFYRRIAQLGRESLKEGGSLFFEINENYGAETLAMLRELGYKNLVLKQDLNGRDRMVKASK